MNLKEVVGRWIKKPNQLTEAPREPDCQWIRKPEPPQSPRLELTPDDFIRAINEQRSTYSPLVADPDLMAACEERLRYIRWVNHSPDTREFFFQGLRSNFDTTVLDIARDWASYNNWKSSLLNSDFTKIGLAIKFEGHVCKILCEVDK